MRLNMEYQMLWRGSGGRNNVNSNHMGGLVIGVCGRISEIPLLTE